MYIFTITQSNSCRLISGCTGENSTAEIACKYVSDIVGVVTDAITLTSILIKCLARLGVGSYIFQCTMIDNNILLCSRNQQLVTFTGE